MSVTIAPRPQHRAAGTEATLDSPVPGLLSRVFRGDPLPGFRSATPATVPDRHPVEIETVTRALACPDIFVIHAPEPLTGEQLIGDVARLTSERTLILSPGPAAVDRLVERFARASAPVVRALAEDENPVRPSPLVSRRTSLELGAERVARLRREVSEAVSAVRAHARCAAAHSEVTARLSALECDLRGLQSARSALESEVRTRMSADPPDSHHAATLCRVTAEHTALQAEIKSRTEQLELLRNQHAEALRKPSFFARLFGKASAANLDAATLEQQVNEAERALTELTTRCEALRCESRDAELAVQGEREAAIQARLTIERANLDCRIVEVETQISLVRAEQAALPPLTEAATSLSHRDLEAAEEQLADLTRNAAELARKFLAEPRIVVGTPASLDHDPLFTSTGGAEGTPFGLLILDRAEELTEHDFLHLARLAQRWILVGDVPRVEETKPYLNGAPRNGSSRQRRPMDCSFLSRLAQSLDRETWTTETDRLRCRLAHTTPEQRLTMVREPLLDRPEIELRFVTPTHETGEPVLAEVVFPSQTSIATAKAFLFQQLGEVLLRTLGEPHWHHHADLLAACWPSVETGIGSAEISWIELDVGVREKVVGDGVLSFTAAITFATTDGWDVEKASAWLDIHQNQPFTSRFASVVRKI